MTVTNTTPQVTDPGLNTDSVARLVERTLPPPNLGSKLQPPDPAVWTLHVEYEQSGDRNARDELFNHYSPYARRLARSLYRHGTESVDELAQVAYEALLLAIDRFETERRLPFEAFARPTIIGSLKRHYRDQGWSIRVPRRVHEIAAPAREATDRLTQELGRIPRNEEVAGLLDVSEETVREVALATRRRSPLSMDSPLGESGEDDGWSQLGANDPNLATVEDVITLTDALHEIDEQDRQLVALYFFDELTQSEIGERIGCSQMQVSRRLDRVIRRLRSRVISG